MSGRPRDATVQAILLDIEGTTTPIAFVVETLFPYARHRLRAYLNAQPSSQDNDTLFERFRAEWEADHDHGAPPWMDIPRAARVESIAAYSEWLMDGDRKSTALKTLQGRIWEEGFTRGELIGEVFPDVPLAFDRWRTAGVHIGIFSSGSVLAQQLLFRYSSAGDLSGYLRWHFDTTTGAKGDPESFRRIATAVAIAADRILFVSDVVGELNAARSSGMQTLLSIRPGNAAPLDDGHRSINSFDAILPGN